MNNTELELLHKYVTIAMKQAVDYRDLYEKMSCDDNDMAFYEKGLTNEEIEEIELLHSDLELQLGKVKDSSQEMTIYASYVIITVENGRLRYSFGIFITNATLNSITPKEELLKRMKKHFVDKDIYFQDVIIASVIKTAKAIDFQEVDNMNITVIE